MKYLNKILLGLACIMAVQSCDIDTIDNPNAPTAESLLNGATLADLRLMAHGVESAVRNDMQFHYWTTNMVGREYYDLNGTDPRYTGELLGAQGAVLDNNGFLTTRAWNTAYRTNRNAINLEIATENSAASLTPEEVNGITGFAKTMEAYALHLELSRQYQNGIRIDVRDPDNLGPIESYDVSLNALADLLDEASGLLTSAGDAFIFELSTGFSDLWLTDEDEQFVRPAEFNKFNRALRARIALYQNDMSAARSALTASFFDIDGDVSTGVYHTFGTSGNDQRNPLFTIPNTDLFTVHQSWLDDAEAGDTRVDAKTTPLDSSLIALPVMLDGLSGSVQVTLYGSDIAQVPLIRNEELMLIYAEANIGSNNVEAVAGINAVRSAAGLADYSGGMDGAALLDEVLKQRRYGLFGEGHRWIDMRRHNRLNQIPTDRAGDVVHIQFPTPVSELN
jgi:starch-binding outer membrane protein, SusD/RagB family